MKSYFYVISKSPSILSDSTQKLADKSTKNNIFVQKNARQNRIMACEKHFQITKTAYLYLKSIIVMIGVVKTKEGS